MTTNDKPIKLMSEERQLEILEAVKQAASYTSDTCTPTQAVVKAAKECEANEHVLQRMVEAYNTGRTLHHMRSAAPEKRAESFELADYEQAKEELFPSEPRAKAACVADQPTKVADQVYDSVIPNFNVTRPKVANSDVLHVEGGEASPLDADALVEPTLRKIGAYGRERRIAQAECDEARSLFNKWAEELACSFKLASCTEDWGLFRKEASAVHGPAIDHILDYVDAQYRISSALDRHKKLSTDSSVGNYVNTQSRSHKIAKALIGLTNKWGRAKQARDTYGEREAAVRGKFLGVPTTKEAAPGALSQLASDLNRYSSTSSAERGETVPTDSSDIAATLNTNNEMRNARISMALRDMAEEDDVISEHMQSDPGGTAAAVRDLAEISPSLLDSRVMLEAALRRHLGLGVADPHEMQQLRDFTYGPKQPIPTALMQAGVK